MPDSTIQSTSEAHEPRAKSVGLCLSGGGFRATLFHLGVIRFLRDAGLLSQIRFISSVSGGSILGAHLVLNWDRYTGPPDAFDRATREILHLAQFDIRGRILRRYPLLALARGCIRVAGRFLGLLPLDYVPLLFDRLTDRLTATGMLEYYYSTLYKGARLSDLPVQDRPEDPTPGAPEIQILGTNITKASICAFSGHGFLSSEDASHHCGREIIKVSEAVAASSAFPGLFPPVHLRRDTVPWDLCHVATENQFIADAGIVDNLGLSLLLQVRRRAKLDFIFVSDATGSVDWAVAERLRYTIGSTLRTLEILTGTSTQLQKETVYQDFISTKRDWTPIYVFIEISRLLENKRVSNETSLKSIRTDLDRFSPTEIFSLAQHGYGVARETLERTGFVEEVSEEVGPEWPLTVLGKRRSRRAREYTQLTSAHRTRLGIRGFARDWLGWMYALLLLAGLPLVALLLDRTMDQRIAEETRKEREKVIDRFKARESVLVEPFEYETRPEAESPPSNDRFEFLEHASYFDLRKWKPRSPGTEGPPSKVHLLREVRVRKAVEEDRFRFEVRTSGTEVYLRALGDNPRFETRPKEYGGQKLKVRQIVLDVSDLEVDEEATLAFEATFYDAFQEPGQWWAGFVAPRRIPRAQVAIVYPENRPFEAYACCQKRKGKEVKKRIDCSDVDSAEDNTHLYWEIEEPERDVLYGLHWIWPDSPADQKARPCQYQDPASGTEAGRAGAGDSS